jgi:histidinol-phosphate aminotransferase
MSIVHLARPAVRDLNAYVAARQEAGTTRLNANENPLPGSGLNRYPEARPVELSRSLAVHFGVEPDHLLVTRGSSEAVDLLIRSFCREGLDDIVITPPTFEMYRVYADIQGARITEVALDPDKEFELDVDALLDACGERSKIVFICTPNNPTGTVTSRDKVAAVAESRRDKSIVVVDEAYIEFSDNESMVGLIQEFDNLAVMRTLSKALALAAVRCGAVMGSPPLVNLLDGVLSPYAMSQPVIDTVTAALSEQNLRAAKRDIERIIVERDRLAAALRECACVEKVWRSQSNFLLTRFHDLRSVQARLVNTKILIREFVADAQFDQCARITVGTPAENDLLLETLSG